MNDQLNRKTAVQSDSESSRNCRARMASARSIYEALRAQIMDGTYASDAPMPSTRGLAAGLGVARSTVTAAYEQLLSEGFIESRQGALARVARLDGAEPTQSGTTRRSTLKPRLSAYGTRLTSLPARTQQRGEKLSVDFSYGDLAAMDFPILAWKRAVGAAAVQRPGRLTYADPRGLLRLRRALQGYLWRARGVRCELDQLIVVNGSQQGLDLCARLLLDAGDKFVIEDPCYATARQIFSATGATPVPVPVDAGGLNTDLLANVDARLAFITPSHQYPLGGIMPIGRRQQLLVWAKAVGAYVIEDDYDSEYRYDMKPVPPVHGLGGESVLYLGTVSKSLSPTLRIGYLIVPPALQEVFVTAKELADRHTPLLEQEALAAMIESGAYERHIRSMRRRNGQRRTILLGALRRCFVDAIIVEGANAGLHVVLWFRDLLRHDEGRLVAAAQQLGLGIYPVSLLFHGDCRHQPDRLGLVMGYASLAAAQIERGVELLRRAVDQVHLMNSRAPVPQSNLNESDSAGR